MTAEAKVGTDTHNGTASWVAAGAVLVLLVLAQVFPILSRMSEVGSWDWDKEIFFAEMQRDEIVRYHQLPFWDPYAYGGMPALAHPESSWLGPSFLLFVLPFGGVIGLKLKLLVALVVGGLGGLALARAEGLTTRAGLLFASGLMLSGYFALHFWIGHSMWAAGALVPWLLVALRHGRHPCWQTVFAAVLAAIMLLEGAMYIVMFSALFCLAVQTLESVRARRAQPVLWTAGALLFGLALTGVKLLPMLTFMSRNPRTFVLHSAEGFNPLPMTGLHLFYDALLFPRYGQHLPFEDGAYLGAIPLTLAVVGVVVSARRRWPWYGTGALFLAIAMGDHGIPGLWSLLRHLPVIEQTIFPQRYLFGALLPILLASAEGLDWLSRRIGHLGRAVAIAALALTLADFTAHNLPVYRSMFTTIPPPRSSWTGPMRGEVLAKTGCAMLAPYRAGFGVLSGHPYIPHPRPHALAFDDPAYRGELYATGGRARLEAWTPNAVRIRVVPITGPVLAVLNQNAAPGWVADGAQARLRPDTSLLSFSAAANGIVTLRYRPPLLLPGLLTSLAAVLACVLVIRGRRGGG